MKLLFSRALFRFLAWQARQTIIIIIIYLFIYLLGQFQKIIN